MRDFLDAILAFIGTTSLTDDEFDAIEADEQVLSLELYAELVAMLDLRESVSNTRDRLKFYFLAANVEVSEVSAAKSNIFIGGALCG